MSRSTRSFGEKQLRRDAEEDEYIGENIQTIAKDGDLSPRQIKQLESSAKRSKSCAPSIPLQVKTRNSKESPEDISQ